MEFSYEINHMPYQTGVWFKYTGFRLKDNYDIETKEGVIHTQCYPNGSSFNNMNTGEVIADTDVVKLRLTPDSDLEEGHDMTGEDRLTRNMDMWAEEYAEVNPTGKPYPCDYPDFSGLIQLGKNVVDELIEKDGYADEDNAQYISTELMTAMYGQGFIDWFNKLGS